MSNSTNSVGVQKRYGDSFALAAITTTVGGTLGAITGSPEAAAVCALATGLFTCGRNSVASGFFNSASSVVKSFEDARDMVSGKALLLGVGTGTALSAALATRCLV